MERQVWVEMEATILQTWLLITASPTCWKSSFGSLTEVNITLGPEFFVTGFADAQKELMLC